MHAPPMLTALPSHLLLQFLDVLRVFLRVLLEELVEVKDLELGIGELPAQLSSVAAKAFRRRTAQAHRY